MPFQHILSFFAVGATAFLATLSLFNAEYNLVFPYVVACGSWIVVVSYDYRERVFDRAIAALVQKYVKDGDNS